MSPLKLYCDAISQPARACMLMVRANKIPCQEITIRLLKDEHKSEAYTKINPFKKIPTIDHDGFRLSESVAILRYLVRTFPVPETWYPKESQAQARVDEYLEYQHLNTRIHVSRYFASILSPQMLGVTEMSEGVIQGLRQKMEKCFDEIEGVFLKRNDFIAGPHITIADLLAVGELEMPKVVGHDVRENRPILGNYLERVRSELNPHYDEVHQILHRAQAAFKARQNVKPS